VFVIGPETKLLDDSAPEVGVVDRSAVTPGRRARVPDRRVTPRRKQTDRGLSRTLWVSAGLHVAALALVLLFLRPPPPAPEAPEKPVEVELVPVEHEGDARPPASPPREASTPSTPATPPDQAPREQQEASAAVQPPRQPPRPAQEARPEAPTAPPAEQPGPKVSLQGTDSPSDARSWGDRVIPVAPDAVFHNRPPVYPMEAAMAGEHGTVIVAIHVSPEGTASGVDVIRSSGYPTLDRSVTEAVARWRFLPAVRDGQAVRGDMRMGFIFDKE